MQRRILTERPVQPEVMVVNYMLSRWLSFSLSFFKKDLYLFIWNSEWAHKQEQEAGGEEAGSLPSRGLTWGSTSGPQPELKADIQPTEPPRCPEVALLLCFSFFPFSLITKTITTILNFFICSVSALKETTIKIYILNINNWFS